MVSVSYPKELRPFPIAMSIPSISKKRPSLPVNAESSILKQGVEGQGRRFPLKAVIASGRVG